jgi:hypothetical protein
MKYRVLWIEDSAEVDVKDLVAPVYLSGKYNLIVALDASEAINQILKSEFAAIVVDIRIPPGKTKEWAELYTKLGANKAKARLGLRILKSLLQPDDMQQEEAQIKKKAPSWITPKVFGILTVESKEALKSYFDFEKAGISVYRQKSASMSITTLLDVFDEIITNRWPNS